MNRNEVYLLLLLILLNIAIRLPITSHGVGQDSFFIHTLGESIQIHGNAPWALHPLSFFGWYPHSYPSAIPYNLAAMQGILGIDMEWVVYLLSLFYAILGMIGMYMLASEFTKKTDLRFLAVFLFSLSPLALKFTHWTISARGPFLMLSPFLVWSLLRIRTDRKYIAIFAFLTLFLAAIHRMFVLVVPLIVAYLLASFTFGRPWLKHLLRKKIALICLSLILLLPQFFVFRYNWIYRYILTYWEYQSTWFGNIFAFGSITFARLGFIVLFAILGFLVLVFSRKPHSFGQVFLILLTFVFLPWFSYTLYFYQMLLSVFCVICIYFFMALDKLKHHYIKFLVLALLVLSLGFSMFTLDHRYSSEVGSNYLSAHTFSASDYLNRLDASKVALEGIEKNRLTSVVHDLDVGMIKQAESYEKQNQPDLRLRALPTSLGELYIFLKMPFDYVERVDSNDVTASFLMVGNSKNKRHDVTSMIYDNGMESVHSLD